MAWSVIAYPILKCCGIWFSVKENSLCNHCTCFVKSKCADHFGNNKFMDIFFNPYISYSIFFTKITLFCLMFVLQWVKPLQPHYDFPFFFHLLKVASCNISYNIWYVWSNEHLYIYYTLIRINVNNCTYFESADSTR